MKTFNLLALFLLSLGIQKSFAQVDLAIGNLEAGLRTYDKSTGTVTGVYFDALNNENGAAGAFRIALFLVDPTNFDNNYEVYSMDVAGQSGNTLVEYTKIDVDFNNTSGIPAGDYRLLVSIDEDNAISETDETNNSLYITTMGNNLEYNPLPLSVNEFNDITPLVDNYPNPASSLTLIKYEFASQPKNSAIRIYNVAGSMIEEIVVDGKQGHVEFSVADINAGIYFYSLVADGKVLAMNKLVVTH